MPKVQCFEAEKLLLFGVAAMTESFAHVKSSRCLKADVFTAETEVVPKRKRFVMYTSHCQYFQSSFSFIQPTDLEKELLRHVRTVVNKVI